MKLLVARHNQEVRGRIGRCQLLDIQIDRRPPPGEPHRVGKDVVDLLRGRLQPPVREKRVLGCHQSLRFAGSSSSSLGRSMRCRERMISMSFLRPLGGPIMIAPTSLSFLKNSLR